MSIVFKHTCNAGDLIASLAGIKEVCEKMDRKATIYQGLNRDGNYYEGAVHPITHDGKMVCMNQSIFDMLRPLILSQSYVEKLEVYTDQKIMVDLDVIRDKCFVNMPNGMIQSWLMIAFPDMACDLSKPWIDVKKDNACEGKGILNYTERYRSKIINYSFLKKYEGSLVFTGTEKEHRLFCGQWDLNIPYLRVDNFLDLAQCLKGAKFVAGNQSMVWNLGNAMGVPRILEMCSWAPNCQPNVGENNFGYYHQGAAEYYFSKLMK